LKTPICTFDAKTGILCAKCETKLRLGHLTHADIEGAMKITKIAEHNQDVNKFTMISAAKVDDDFILILRGSDIIVLRTNTSLSKKFEDEFQSKVWFVEAEATDRRFI
jgi:UDP-N-acetylenolpyruvoylglucosamine reductase